jgi:hypothetical protein
LDLALRAFQAAVNFQRSAPNFVNYGTNMSSVTGLGTRGNCTIPRHADNTL